MRADSAVEPTKSENMTVTWRRSAVSRGDASTAAGPGEGAGLALALPRRAAMASKSFRRCPSADTPRLSHHGLQCAGILALKKATKAGLNSRWNAARSNPSGSWQISGTLAARAGVHGARNAKWPAFGTT